ncbi:MAG: LysR family transcriptional regulator [Clostridium sp.]|jgi:DNA-binding transcriptional LysR family regulator
MKKYEIIVDVCKTKNFTKTAQHLNYSQAAVSQAVKSFEEEMGFPIFERKKSGVELLPVAKDVLQSLNKIIEEEHRLQELSDSLTKTECGVVKIGTIFSIGINLLPKILKEFHRLYPDIKFDIFSGEYDEIHKLLADGEIDIAFTSKDGAEGFTITELFRDEFMAVLPLDHPLSSKPALSIYDFQGCPYIPSGEKFGYEIGEIFNTVKVQPACYFHVTEELISHKMIEAGFGISVSTKYFLDSVPAFANVCIRPFKEHYYRTLVVAKNESRFCPAATTTFIRFLDEQLAIDF